MVTKTVFWSSAMTTQMSTLEGGGVGGEEFAIWGLGLQGFLERISEGFCKLGVLCLCPNSKDYGILGTIFRPHYLYKLPYIERYTSFCGVRTKGG